MTRTYLCIVTILILAFTISCRSDLEWAIERQYRGGISQDSIWGPLTLGMAEDSLLLDQVISDLEGQYGLTMVPFFTNNKLTSCHFYCKDTVWHSAEYLESCFFREGGDHLVIPSKVVDSQLVSIDGNRLIRIFKGVDERWEVVVRDLWFDSLAPREYRIE